MGIRSKHKVDATFSMSSMTDIVFLLLIFFMITSTLVTTNAIKVNLPKTDTKTTKSEGVVVTVKDNLQYYVDDMQVSMAEMESALKRAVAASGNNTIKLNAETTVDLGEAVKIMGIAYNNDIEVILLTQPE